MRSLWCLWCPFESSVNAECILPTLTKYFATFPSGNPKGLYEHNGKMKSFFDSHIVSSCSDSNTILEPFILKRDRHVLEVATFWIHLGIMTGTAPSYFLCMASSWEKMFWEELNLPHWTNFRNSWSSKISSNSECEHIRDAICENPVLQTFWDMD